MALPDIKPKEPGTGKAGPALPPPVKPEPKAKPKSKAKPGPANVPGLLIKKVDFDMYRLDVTFAIRIAKDGETTFQPADIDVFFTLMGDGSRDAVSFDLTEDTAGFLQSHGGHFIIGLLVYKQQGETFPRLALSSLVHECDHCATDIIRHLCMNSMDKSGDEVHAYLTGHLVRQLYKFLVASNVFIDNAN